MLGIDVNASRMNLIINLTLMGIGMGLSIPAFLIVVQSTVQRSQLGAATSTLQFSRSIGGALGVSVMGVILSLRLATNLVAAGLDPAVISLNSLIDPLASAAGNAGMEVTLRVALAGAVHSVFVIAFIAALLGLLVTTLAPSGRIAQLVARRVEPESKV